MRSITLTDWLVILVYLFSVTVIGMVAASRVKNSAAFFISQRKFGKLMMTFLGFGAGSHVDQAVSVAAMTYHSGVSGIWYQWLWLFVTPFYWVVAPLVRRMRVVTVSDYFEHRYDHSVSSLYAVLGILQMMVAIGLMLRGSAAMITAVSGGEIDAGLAIGVMTVLFLAYGVAGGLTAAAWTDLIQGLMTIVLSFLILPFALMKVGGMSGLRQAVADPAMFEIVAPGEITVFFIAVVALNAMVGWITQPTAVLVGAGKTEYESRMGHVTGSLIKRICTVAWTLTGLCAVALYAGREVVDVDHVYGLMAHDLLPAIGPGLLGLFIACMLASVMSSCDAFMVLGAGLFVENIYRPFVAGNELDRHYILMGRVASVLVVVGSLLFAFTMQSVVTGLEIFWKVAAMMGVAAWVGIFWRRATVAGAWAGTLAGFFTWICTERIALGKNVLWDFNATLAAYLPDFMLWEQKLHLPWQMVAYLSVSFVVVVVVSLLTKPVDAAQLDRFYVCLRTPVSPDEPQPKACTLPEGIRPAPRRVLINHPDFEIPVPTVVSVIGFVVVSVICALIVLAAVWIFSLGQ